LASPVRLATVWKRFITEAYLPDPRSPTQAREKQERERERPINNTLYKDPSTIPFTRKEATTERQATERKQAAERNKQRTEETSNGQKKNKKKQG
jgi:hypothetical protein